jgi:small redox-active disulfide protein 2
MVENDIKQIVIEGHKVSLFGLQEIFTQIKEMRIIDKAQLKEKIVKEVGKRNYIAPLFKEKYANTLYEEYQLFIGEIKERKDKGPLTIRVLGPGCYNCERLFELTLQVLSEMGVSADLDKVTDPAMQRQFGITATPALIVNNKVKVTGRVPAKAEVKEWIKGAIS